MKKHWSAVVMILLLFSGCSTNTKATRNISREIADPFLLEGNVSASSVITADSQYAITKATSVNSQRQKLAEFSTKFNAKDKARANNIKTASQSIDETIVYPGETFSYNETVGPTTKRNGYQKATIYDKGKKSTGYGGGVCQVSSTLYNTAEKAGMEIVERHHHSLPVTYVEDGKDAATSYGVIDFKFVNNKDFPVKINSWTSEDQVVVGIEVM